MVPSTAKPRLMEKMMTVAAFKGMSRAAMYAIVNTSGMTFGGMLSRPRRRLRKRRESSTKMMTTASMRLLRRSPTTASIPVEPL